MGASVALTFLFKQAGKKLVYTSDLYVPVLVHIPDPSVGLKIRGGWEGLGAQIPKISSNTVLKAFMPLDMFAS